MIYVTATLLLCIVFAQSCMKFRISDRKAISKFTTADVSIKMETIAINGFNIHFAKTGHDSFPTLFLYMDLLEAGMPFLSICKTGIYYLNIE